MRRLLCAVVILALVVCIASCSWAGKKTWRFSVSQLQPTASEIRDYESHTRGATVEYSLGNTFGDEDTASEVSVFAGYMRVSYVQFDSRDATKVTRHDIKSDVYSLGLNWRFGAGASPARDGFYAGFGAAFAFGSPAVDTGAQTFGGLGGGAKGSAFEWRAMAGMNFAAATFGEAGYQKIGPDGVYSINVGIRL